MPDRYWSKVDRSGGPDACWPWTRSRNANGYGRWNAGGGRIILAHRTAWERANGPIPPGKLVLHRCDVRPCCNPLHLFLGTHADNSADMVAKGRHPHNASRPRRYTDAQVAEMRTMREAGETVAAIARRFGADPGWTSRTLRGQRRAP